MFDHLVQLRHLEEHRSLVQSVATSDSAVRNPPNGRTFSGYESAGLPPIKALEEVHARQRLHNPQHTFFYQFGQAQTNKQASTDQRAEHVGSCHMASYSTRINVPGVFSE